MLEPMKSQYVAGTKGVEIYPYIRKIDIMSSNSYIISGDDQIALIDPGGLDDQIEHLDREIMRLQEEQSRPLVVYLTHVHSDHWIQFKQSRKSRAIREAALAIQEIGAKGLEKGDSNITLAALLGRQVSPTPVEIKLLSAQDMAVGGEHCLDMGGWSLDYSIRSMSLDGLLLHSQSLPLGKDDRMEIYHLPGHSPDSICLQTGSILVVGDIYFALNPGIAGACGWSRQDFMESIKKLLWILENRNIVSCCSGHGRPIDSETAKKTLRAIYRDATLLDGIAEVSPEWAKSTSSYALDLMGELERIFTIIGGRLAFISHVLDHLEEKSGSEELISFLSTEKIDDIFCDFNYFAEELRAGRRMDIEMVHNTGQIVGKLERLFEKDRLSSVIDKSLLSRAQRLLSDYSEIYRGFRPPYYVEYTDINKLVGDILEQIGHDPHEDMAILDAESEEDYLMALKMRIAHINLFEKIDLAFEPDSKSLYANMDRERFSDTLIDILERFAAARPEKIRIATALNDDWVSLRIAGVGIVSYNPAGGRSQRFLEMNLSLCGGLMELSSEGDSAVVEIEFSSYNDV